MLGFGCNRSSCVKQKVQLSRQSFRPAVNCTLEAGPGQPGEWLFLFACFGSMFVVVKTMFHGCCFICCCYINYVFQAHASHSSLVAYYRIKNPVRKPLNQVQIQKQNKDMELQKEDMEQQNRHMKLRLKTAEDGWCQKTDAANREMAEKKGCSSSERYTKKS